MTGQHGCRPLLIVTLHDSRLARELEAAFGVRMGDSVRSYRIRHRFGPQLVRDLENIAEIPGHRMVIGRREPGLWQAVVALALSRNAFGPERVYALLPACPAAALAGTAVEPLAEPLDVGRLARRLWSDSLWPESRPEEVKAATHLLALNWHSLPGALLDEQAAEHSKLFMAFVQQVQGAPLIWHLLNPLGATLVAAASEYAAAKSHPAMAASSAGSAARSTASTQSLYPICDSIWERFWR